MFSSMDADRNGTITFDELKTGLNRLGSAVTEAEVQQLLEAVSNHYIGLLKRIILTNIPCNQY
jgi:calcium-dependent protein kinase